MKTLFKAGNEGKVLGGELEMKGMRRPYQHTKITNKRYSNGRKEVGEEKDKEEEEAIDRLFAPRQCRPGDDFNDFHLQPPANCKRCETVIATKYTLWSRPPGD